MADNYLEKRMEDYRGGKLASVRIKHASGAKDAVVIHVHGRNCQSIVNALRGRGAKTSFSGPDAKAGAILAQTSGSTFCPMALTDAVDHMSKARGRLDAIVLTDDIPETLPESIVTINCSDSERPCTHRVPSALSIDEKVTLILALAKVCTPLRIEVKSVVE